MKTFRNEKGFTLIELLAVIVVLAIVTTIAVSVVLPQIPSVKQDAFVVEANALRTGASDAITAISLGYVQAGSQDSNYKVTTSDSETVYCFTMTKLIELGFLKNKDVSDIATDKYEGVVKVTSKNDSPGYTYSINMHNESYYVTKTSGEVKKEDLKDYDKSQHDELGSFTCGE